MKKRGIIIVLLVLFALTLIGWFISTQKEQPGSRPEVTTKDRIQLGSDWQFIQQAEGDLYGNNAAERVSLAEKKNRYQPETRWLIWINSEKVLELDNKQGTYDYARITLEDVDGDAYKELLVFRTNGGSGAGSGLTVYKVRENGLSTILETDPGFEDQDNFVMKYLGNYQVNFQSQRIGIDKIIKLKPDNYRGIESELQKIDSWVDPIAEYEINDLDNDGQKEITGIRRVIGISHPDTIALLKVTYKLLGDKYANRPMIYTLYDAEGKLIFVKTFIK